MVLPPRHGLSRALRALLCPGPSLWPCPAGTGDTGQGTGPAPGSPLLSSSCGCGGWTGSAPTPLGMVLPSLSLSPEPFPHCSLSPGSVPHCSLSPGSFPHCPIHQGPSLPVPVTRVLSRVPGTAGSEQCRAPGKHSPGQAWVPPAPCPDLPRAPGRAMRGQPRPRGPRGHREHTSTGGKGRVLPCSCAARAARDGIPFPGAQPRGRGGKVTRSNEGEPLRAESPQGQRGAAPARPQPVQKSEEAGKQINNNKK